MGKTGRKLKAFVSVLVLATAWSATAPFLAEYLIVQRPLKRADAIVVMSGSTEYIERSRHAAELFRTGVAPKIYLTKDGLRGGWNDELKRNPSWAERAHSELIDHGVPENAIEVFPTIVHSTYDEANVLVKSLSERRVKSVVLVTSAYHSRRALSTFDERAKADASVIADIGIQSPPGLSIYTWWLTAQGWNSVGLEWIKTFYYHACY